MTTSVWGHLHQNVANRYLSLHRGIIIIIIMKIDVDNDHMMMWWCVGLKRTNVAKHCLSCMGATIMMRIDVDPKSRSDESNHNKECISEIGILFAPNFHILELWENLHDMACYFTGEWHLIFLGCRLGYSKENFLRQVEINVKYQ